MKSELRIMAGVVGIGVALGVYSALAQDRVPSTVPPPPPSGERPKGDWKKPDMVDLTLTGKIIKGEKEGRGGAMEAFYSLSETTGGTIVLPAIPRHSPSRGETPGAVVPAPEAPAINYEDFVGKDVIVTGKGYTGERGGIKSTHLEQVMKIEVVAAPAGAK